MEYTGNCRLECYDGEWRELTAGDRSEQDAAVYSIADLEDVSFTCAINGCGEIWRGRYRLTAGELSAKFEIKTKLIFCLPGED